MRQFADKMSTKHWWNDTNGKTEVMREQDRQCTVHSAQCTVCVQRNIEARSRNHFCSGKAVSINYWCVCGAWVSACVSVGARVRALACACVRVALLIQHAKRRHIAICGLFGSTTFWTLSQMARFSEKRY